MLQRILLVCLLTGCVVQAAQRSNKEQEQVSIKGYGLPMKNHLGETCFGIDSSSVEICPQPWVKYDRGDPRDKYAWNCSQKDRWCWTEGNRQG